MIFLVVAEAMMFSLDNKGKIGFMEAPEPTLYPAAELYKTTDCTVSTAMPTYSNTMAILIAGQMPEDWKAAPLSP